jgi:hypothetical protein
MAPQFISDRLIGHVMTQVGEGTNDSVISHPEFSRAMRTTKASTFGSTVGRP